MSHPPRRARSVTPAPTIPPPAEEATSAAPVHVEVDGPVEVTARRIGTLQALLGAAVLLVGAGVTGHTLFSGKADVTALDQVRAGAAANLASATAGTTAQLGALAAQVQDLRTHQAAVDASLTGLSKDVGRLTATTDVIYLQLVEIASRTGARQVPAPPPERTTP